MSKFIPTFYVMNKQGRFLAKNPKSGRHQLPGMWSAARTGTGAPDAEGFASWEEAAAWGMTLPVASHPHAAIVDQNGQFWNADAARKAKVFFAKPAAANTDAVVEEAAAA